MNLQTYIERSKLLDLSVVPEKYRDELFAQLEDDVQLPDLVAESSFLIDNLPRPQLRRLFDARGEWRARQRAVDRLAAVLGQSGLPMPPASTRERALVPNKVDALERAVRICPRDDFPNEDAWGEALSSLLDVWSGAVNQTLRRGAVTTILDGKHPDSEQFDQFARRKELLSELPTHRWQAIRRGERAGALSLEFELPLTSIQGHLEGIKGRLGETAAARSTEALVDELVLSVLPGTVKALLDQKADGEAIRNAVGQYQKLLTGPPLAIGRVGAVAVRGDGSRVGAIVVSTGNLPELQEVVDTTEDGWEGKVSGLFSVAGVEQVVAPIASPAEATLDLVVKALEEDYEVVKVRVSALSEARRLLTEPPLSLPPEIASALVLARRALQPSDEWERVDPVAIGLCDYQQDVDEERLRDALVEALGLFQLDRATGVFVAPTARPQPRKPAPPKVRLNPLVKSLADLRPGMMLEGIITNITRFGAFVNIGLSDEGMIHISELSAEFVQTPSDVVNIGDRVQARVLDVEPNKRRIALSLKAAQSSSALERRSAPSGRNVPLDTRVRPNRDKEFDRGRTGASPVGRAAALQQLESLFKK
ncbi:MAG: S1 RNA-binding domain-containing protein [Polyangia bacterium]|nr:S1 RNA-binding domain-containing protein [Polyangia bacterium]